MLEHDYYYFVFLFILISHPSLLVISAVIAQTHPGY